MSSNVRAAMRGQQDKEQGVTAEYILPEVSVEAPRPYRRAVADSITGNYRGVADPMDYKVALFYGEKDLSDTYNTKGEESATQKAAEYRSMLKPVTEFLALEGLGVGLGGSGSFIELPKLASNTARLTFHPRATYRLARIYNPISFNNVSNVPQYRAFTPTEKLMSLLGRVKSNQKLGQFTYTQKPLAAYLLRRGVDISKFSDRDLIYLTGLRSRSIKLPIKGRAGIIYDVDTPYGVRRLLLDVYDDGKLIGNAYGSAEQSKKAIEIDDIAKLDGSASGMSEDAYNALINYGQKSKIAEGVISGNVLLSPEKTYRVWGHFPDKKLIGMTGEHHFGQGVGLRGSVLPYTIDNGPVYLLPSTSSKPLISSKSFGIFDPDLIQAGKLLPPDWSNLSPFYKNGNKILHKKHTG